MHSEHTANGVGSNKITVNEKGEIHLLYNNESIKIGNIQSFYELEQYEDGTYTDNKGNVVDIEQLINNFVVTDIMAERLKQWSDEQHHIDTDFSERMHLLRVYVGLIH